MCRMFDDTKKRCQETRCEKCKMFSPIREDDYEPLFDIEYGLGIDHQLKHRKENNMSQEELIKFLKDNLRIEITSTDLWETKEICIRLYLGDETLSCEYISV